jgi:hypothetical protein
MGWNGTSFVIAGLFWIHPSEAEAVDKLGVFLGQAFEGGQK